MLIAFLPRNLVEILMGLLPVVLSNVKLAVELGRCVEKIEDRLEGDLPLRAPPCGKRAKKQSNFSDLLLTSSVKRQRRIARCMRSQTQAKEQKA